MADGADERLYSFMRNNALSRDKLNYQRGSVKNIHYGDIHTKFQTLFDIAQESVPYINDTEPLPPFDSEDYCVEGDLIFADASEDTNDVGKSIEIVRLNGERLLSGQHTILARRNDERLILGFGGHLFRSGSIRSQIMKEAQGTKVYAISATRLGKIEVAFPAYEKEQQKIADCLTSLDEVIAAQGRKVETLKAHKKGLMQQLFPREGENYHYIKGKFDFHQRVYCIYDFSGNTSGQFFFQYFSLHFKKRVKQMSAKNSVDSVRMSMITEMPIWLPQIEEQQRIADCLSSLDARIAAEADKLAVLRTHKKGLMQQLFPSTEELDA